MYEYRKLCAQEQIELVRRRLRLGRHLGRIQGFFKQVKHDSSMHVSTVLDQTVAGAIQKINWSISDGDWLHRRPISGDMHHRRFSVRMMRS